MSDKNYRIWSKDIPSGRVLVSHCDAGNYISRKEVLRVLRKIERKEWNIETVIDVLFEN